MKLHIIAQVCNFLREAKEVSTKTGLRLDITKKEDIEGNKNRGWQVDLYTATVKGSQAWMKLEAKTSSLTRRWTSPLRGLLDELDKLTSPSQMEEAKILLDKISKEVAGMRKSFGME